MSSPYIYEDGKTPEEIIEIYKLASDFGLKYLNESDLFNTVLYEVGEIQDEQDKLSILDYLMSDFTRANFGITANSLKAAISSY